MKSSASILHQPPATLIPKAAARVTICRVEGAVEAGVGETLFLESDGTIASTIANNRLARAALIDAQAALRDRQSFTMRYSLPSGAIASRCGARVAGKPIDLAVEWTVI